MSRKNWIASLRWLIIIYFVGVYFLLPGRLDIKQPLLFFALVSFVAFYNLFISIVAIEKWPEVKKKTFSYIILLFDVSAVTLLVYLIKVSTIPLFILYIFVIFGAGYAYSLKGALAATILSILFYTGIEVDKLYNLASREILFSQIIFLLAVGIIVALLSNELTKHKKEKELFSYLSLISQKLTSTYTIDEILNLVMEIASLIKLETVILMLLDEETDEFYISSHKGISEELINNLRISKKLPEIAKIVTSKRPLIVPDTTKTTISKVMLLQKGIRSFIDLPLVGADKVIGILSLSSTKPHKFKRDELKILETLSSQAAIAIEKVKLYENIIKDQKQLTTLYKITEEINSILSFDDLLEYIINATAKLLGAQTCSLMLLDNNNELVIKKARGLSKDVIAATKVKAGEGIIGNVVKEGRPYLAEDNTDDKVEVALCVPLKVKKKIIGVINVNNKKDGSSFNKDDLQILTTLANQTAATIERAQLYDDLQTSYLSTIASLAATLDAKDGYIHGHSKEVATYAVKIAQKMNLSKEEIDNIYYATMLCDLGKISIKDRVLQKKKQLTDRELDLIEEHPTISANIIKEAKFLQDVIPIILHHHERYDGYGYPDGLKGEEIPLGARIINIADSYHAMISDRPYRKALTEEEAKRELKKNANSQFDPHLVKIFLKILEEEKEKL